MIIGNGDVFERALSVELQLGQGRQFGTKIAALKVNAGTYWVAVG